LPIGGPGSVVIAEATSAIFPFFASDPSAEHPDTIVLTARHRAIARCHLFDFIENIVFLLLG